MHIKIYHYPLCPYSRFLRIVLNEKGVIFETICEYFWDRRHEFLQLNPAGQTPVILHPESEIPIWGTWSMFEFIEEKHLKTPMIYDNKDDKIKIRAVTEWFCQKFYNEVTKYILNEKVIKTLQNNSSPQSNLIRAAKKNLLIHIDYIKHLLDQTNYIAGDKISLADYAAAAQLSVLDYLGDVPWERNEKVKIWYSLIKSRPSFRSILNDNIREIRRSEHYSDLDW